uniref:acyl-CoA thioesterase n=1 Tax=Ningiella ruwaisensis TaxID=2364274 RepID=UPI00109FC01A|nr:thioesterase family protein [Ningiella ruwaisensis]
MSKSQAQQRHHFTHFFDITTRWSDNDIYGHVNNVIYYSYFDSLVNQFLIKHGELDIHKGATIGLMVKSQCEYFTSIAFPDEIYGGFRVERIGNSSVDYALAIFKKGKDEACAQGLLTHVFVDKDSQKPKKIDGKLLNALRSALIDSDPH